MFRYTAVTVLIVGYLFFISVISTAQETTCPDLVQSAFVHTETACTDTGRNQACYGHGMIQVESVDEIQFDAVGDRIAIASIASMQLSPMEVQEDMWGIALLRIQANLPDTTPGQNVQLILFGDVEIEDRGTTTTEMTATATGGVNVRSRPTTAQNNVIESLAAGEAVTAVGRLEDTSWIQIRLDTENDTLIGWVSADFLRSEDAFSTLTVVEPGDPQYSPMQAFVFRTGIGDAACDEAPDSGILIQTPKGVGEINLLANSVKIDVGSTIFVQSQPDDDMIVSVLEGRSRITALGVSLIAPAGVRVRIPMSPESEPLGSPEYMRYDAADFANLPLQLLDDDMTVAAPSVTPTITGIENFPDNVLPGDRVKRSFYINFINPNGDAIERVFATCTSTTYPSGCASWVFDAAGHPLQDGWLASGDWTQGRIGFPIQCGTGGAARESTTLAIAISDAAGNRSNNASITFDCVNP